ncbi:Uncharacterised protein [Bordetella pertussis]|nr:Uncharacterised protein [Bordetella pertussis]
MMVWPALFRREMNSHRVRRRSTSTPAVGSSSTMTGGAVHQGLRHQHAALHAVRQRAHVGIGLVGQAQVEQDFVDPVVVAAQAEIAGLDAQRLAHGEEWVVDQLLRHHAQGPAGGLVVGHDVVAAHAGAAGGGVRQAGQDRDQGGLAGAVGAEQAEELAVLDLQADIVERLEARGGRLAEKLLPAAPARLVDF